MIGDPPTRALDLALRTSADSATVLAPHLADLLQSLAHDLLDHIEEIAETVNARAITHEPLLADPDDPLGSETTMQSTRANVGAIISMLAYGVPADAFGVSAFPFFVAVDGDNNVIARASGELTVDQWTGLLDQAASAD